MIEILLQFTEVVVDKDDDVAMKWEKGRDWINVKVAYFPLLSVIVNPAYFLIRGNSGGAGPGRAALEGCSVAQTVASMEVTRPAVVGHARIPDLHRFADLAGARIARIGLRVWASKQVPESCSLTLFGLLQTQPASNGSENWWLSVIQERLERLRLPLLAREK